MRSGAARSVASTILQLSAPLPPPAPTVVVMASDFASATALIVLGLLAATAATEAFSGVFADVAAAGAFAGMSVRGF